MKKFLTLIATAFLAVNANAQISITAGAGLTYTQNFNTLDTSVAGSSITPLGWSFAEVGAGAANNGLYKGGNGNSNSGDTYSFGLNGSTDRCFGMLASGTALTGMRSTIGAVFTNNSGSALTSLNLTANIEQWRKGDTIMIPDTMICSISYVNTVIDTLLPGWLLSPSFNMTSSVTNAAIANGAIDGNMVGNFYVLNQTVPVNIPIGGTFAIRWYDPNNAGSDDGIGIDDATFTFTTGVIVPVTPIISSLVPADNSTNVPLTTPITLNLSQNVTAGTGNIVLTNVTDGTTQIFAVPSANVSILGPTVTITGANLVYAKDYAIALDSACFNNQGLKFAGIYNLTTWNFTTALGAPQPLLGMLVPADNANNVALTTAISATFSQPITAGTGNITLKNITDGTSNTYAVPGLNVTIAGQTVTLTGFTLANSKQYAIQMDSTCFNNAGTKIKGIYNDTTWNFNTVAVVVPVTSLNETYTNCLAPLLGSFTQYTKVGTQTWRCSTFGHNDANCVVVNGFSGAALANEDYLISPPLNFTAMAAPHLHFWSKVRFAGATTKDVLVTTNYTGGDPTLATWTNLNVSLAGLDTAWKAYGSANLTPYKAGLMHVAFKYVSTATAADEWSIDDVNITDGVPTSIETITLNSNELAILGNANDGILRIALDSKQNQQFGLQLLDANGRIVYKSAINATAGTSTYTFNLPNLSTGIYFVKVQNNTTNGVVKFTKL